MGKAKVQERRAVTKLGRWGLGCGMWDVHIPGQEYVLVTPSLQVQSRTGHGKGGGEGEGQE